jgi:hypothetical protein
VSKGFIAVPRAMFTDRDPFWAEHRPRTQWEAWLDVVQLTAAGPYDHVTDHGVVRLERGEVLLSRRHLATRWNWSEKVVRRWLKTVTEMGRVKAQRRAYDGTVYLVVNYDTYNLGTQQKGPEKGREKGHERATKRPKIDSIDSNRVLNRDSSSHQVQFPNRESSVPRETPPGETIPDPRTPEDPPRPAAPSAGTVTRELGEGAAELAPPTALEKLPKALADQAYTNWGSRFGAVNYGRLRAVLLDCVDIGIPSEQLPDAVEAYADWYDGLSDREQSFNRPAPEKFAVEARRWARLGQMPLSIGTQFTERGMLLLNGLKSLPDTAWAS